MAALGRASLLLRTTARPAARSGAYFWGQHPCALVLMPWRGSAGTVAGLELPPCDFKPSPYVGPSFEKTLQIRKTNLSPALFTYYAKPLLIHQVRESLSQGRKHKQAHTPLPLLQGHMQWLFDHENRRYLDFFGGIVTVSVGHCHPHVNKALKDQVDKCVAASALVCGLDDVAAHSCPYFSNRLWHTTNIYMHPKIHEYAEALTARLPGDLKVRWP
jgi:alanine-glyoxylate transaminase / (R)-3-amino-2-methylpropionate-pyruvate transaminase